MSTQIVKIKSTRFPVKAFLATILSILVPVLGQIYARKGERGAAILLTTIIVGNLNAIWISLYGTTGLGERNFWTSDLPLLLHNLFAAYAIIFVIWQVTDAYQQAEKEFYRR